MKLFHRKITTRLVKNPRFIIGFTIIFLVLVAAILAPHLARYPLGDSDITQRLASPSAEHWLGCDLNGSDIMTSMLYGARTSLYVGFLTVLLSLVLGVTMGITAGYFAGPVDMVLMRIVDIFMAFPGILLSMALTALMGPSVHTVVFAIAATGWTSSARLIRGQVLSLREREYVEASRALGATHGRLIWKHIFPGTLSPLIVHATFSLSGVIIVEAGLSFLGLGAQDGALTWGGLLGQGSQIELAQAPHLTIFPGMAIFCVVIALNFLGDALRDTLDPHLK